MADEKATSKKTTKTKRPTPLKRDLQNERRRVANRSFRSSVLTAVRSLEKAVAQKQPTVDTLNHIYSLVDKGVKNGVFKSNKAARIKSRLTLSARA